MKKIFFGLSVALVAISITTPSLVFAAPTMSETLDAVKNLYTFNGTIYSAVTDGETLYLGGGFDTVTPNTGEAALFDETTEEQQLFPTITTEAQPGTVYAVITDGNGGWYLGGSFTHIDGAPQQSIAHVLADGTLDSGFESGFVAYGATVYALSLSPDGQTLYVGGSFAEIDGEPSVNLAALDAQTGALDEVFVPEVNDLVYALTLSSDGEILYVGGGFSQINASNVYGLGALNTSDGSLVDGVDFNGESSPEIFRLTPRALALSSDGQTLYVGNQSNTEFGIGDGLDALFAFDTSDGSQLAFDPDVNDGVYATTLSPDGSALYIGGSFTGAGGELRTQFAAIDTTTGLATPLDAGITGVGDDTVFAIGLSSDGETIYIGGDNAFTAVGGQARTYFAEIDADTGLATSFYPEFDSSVFAIAVADGQVLAGGSFTRTQPAVTRNEVAAIDLSTYELTDFDPDVVPYNENTTYALALSPDGGTLYIGGNISGVNGGDAARARLAAVDTTTALATEFDPDLDGPVYALTVSPDGTTVYAGGAFGTANGGVWEQGYLSAFDAVTGAPDEAFVPEPDDYVYALTLSSDGDTLYAGGGFTGGILAVDAATGETLVTPPVSPNGNVRALTLSPDEGTLYIGGLFDFFDAGTTDVGEGFVADADTGAVVGSPNILSTNASTVYTSIPDGNGGWYVGGSFNRINGEAWNSRIVHILPNNVIDTNFEPDFGVEGGDVHALALSADGETLYAGGQFLNVEAEERAGLAAFDTSDGSLLSFNPSIGDIVGGALVRTLELDGNTLYVGGQFTCVGYDYGGNSCTGDLRNNLAAIDVTTGLATLFDPDVNGTGVYDIDISADSEVLYAGGGFFTVNGDQERRDFAAFSLAPETLGEVTALDPGLGFVGETVHAVAESSDGSTVYIGGAFYTTVDEVYTYTILAAVDVEANAGVGAISEAFPRITGQNGQQIVDTLTLSPDDSILYVGGYLWDQGIGAFALSTEDGSVVDTFTPNLDPEYDAEVFTVGGPQNGEIFIGGSVMTVLNEGGGTRQGLAALDTTDLSLMDFNPDIDFLSVYSLALSSDGEALYVGGDQDGGTYLASFDTESGDILFSPELGTSGDIYALALSPDDTELYTGSNEGNRYAIYSSDDEEQPPVVGEEENNGGGGSSRRHPVVIDPVKAILEQLILLLQQLIAQLIAEQQN